MATDGMTAAEAQAWAEQHRGDGLFGAYRPADPPNRNNRAGGESVGQRRPLPVLGDKEWIENSKPHPSTASRHPGLVHGSMMKYNDMGRSGTVGQWNRHGGGVKLRFLFNPWRIGVNWNVNPDVLTKELQQAGDGTPETANKGPAGQANLDFQLLFDRGPEVQSGAHPEGVLHDLSVLQALTMDDGMLTAGNEVVFRSGNSSLNSFNLVGFITSLNVNLTNFSEKMVPMRASVDIALVRTSDLMRFGAYASSNEFVSADTASGERSGPGSQPATPRPRNNQPRNAQ